MIRTSTTVKFENNILYGWDIVEGNAGLAMIEVGDDGKRTDASSQVFLDLGDDLEYAIDIIDTMTTALHGLKIKCLQELKKEKGGEVK